MRKLRILISVFGFLVACLLALAVYVYSTEDSIGKAHWDTVMIVQGYAWGLKGDEQVVEWITEYHGEAPGAEVRAVILNFGIRHPRDFLRILKQIPVEKRTEVIDLLRFSLEDTGQEKAFQASFGYPFAQLSKALAEQ